MRSATVDAVIIDGSRVVLVKRRFEPYKGFWTTPGGFVEDTESVEQAVVREVLEETGLKVEIVKLVGVYSDPNRDPRKSVTTAFLARALSKDAKGGDDAQEAKWFELDALPKMAFDHEKIINDARRIL